MNNENLELANTRSRALAFVIDDFLITFIVLIMYWDKISVVGNDLETVLVVMNEYVWQILLLKFIYQTLFVWYYGATVGKIITKIKVIDYTHLGRVSIFTSISRSLLRLVSEMFFYVGFVFAFFNDGRQTFHDKIAKTLVVNA
ncbi:MAG: RDD family protein [Arcobacter sp.]|nr:MAG: RDD family protein [Arcobacter sp.]